MEKNIDSMKYRKSTHLAGVDVETIIAEKGKCILTIKEVFYDRGVNVSGNKTDGYFATFIEDVKPMVLNSGNRKIIGANLKTLKGCSSTDSRNIGNWAGLTIELWFDESVKMMGATVGGIKVKPENPIKQIDTVKASAVLNVSTTLPELQTNWSKLSKDEQAHPVIAKLKEDLKTKLS